MNKYPMVYPITFAQNLLINHLANDPNWTVSDEKKRPINAKKLLADGIVKGARLDGENPLVTLGELDANKDLQAVNRAYRLRARENNVIAIDVEPEASEDMKQFALNFPAHYTELSMNGGVHLLILVPDDCITPDNEYMFKNLSVFKEPVPKNDKRPAHYEVIFNDHYITFTKRMDTEKVCIDYNTDHNAKKQLIMFLTLIVKIDKERKEKREIAKKYSISIVEDGFDSSKKELIQEFIDLKMFEPYIDEIMKKTIDDFGGDGSRYEMSTATSLANRCLHMRSTIKDTMTYREMAKNLTEQDLVYAIYLLLKRILPERDKHEETREGLPWLMYIAKNAFEFVKANDKSKSK